MNWFMPAFVSSRPDSGGGISDDERTRRVPALLEEREERLTDLGCLPPSESTGGSVAGHRARRRRRSSASRSSIARLPSWIDSETSFDRSSRPPLASRAMVCGATRCGLLARPAAREDRARRSGAEAERDPEASLHVVRPRAFAKPLRHAGAHADDLHQGARGGLFHQTRELLHPPDDLGGAHEHRVDPVELAVGPLDRPLDLAQQRHGSPRASCRSSSSCSRARGRC